MQLDNVPTFSKHLNGKMEDIQEADNLRMIVKVQKPSLGEGMCLVNNIDKSFYSFIMPTHVMYGKLVSMIEEMTDNKYRAYFYATPFDKYHVVVHDIFAPNQSW